MEFGEPPASQPFIFRYLRDGKLTIWTVSRNMSVDDERSPTHVTHLLHEFPRLIKMVEKAAAKDGVKRSILFHVSYIVANEVETREICRAFDAQAILEVTTSHLDAERTKSRSRELYRVTTLKTSKIDNGFIAEPIRKSKPQKPECKLH